jgi:hypothetical protein
LEKIASSAEELIGAFGINKTRMLSGRAQKTHRRTSPLQEVLHDFGTRFGHVWLRDERDQLKREKEIHTFAAANGWLATILDPGIQVTFRKVGI